MKTKVIRTVFNVVLALFLAVIILAGSLFYLAETSLCNPVYLADTARTSPYTQELYEQIAYDWEDLMAITGILEPQSIMTVLTTERVAQDALHYLNSAYNGTASLPLDDLHEQLEGKVREYVNVHFPSAEQNPEQEENIKSLVNACISDYRSAISIPGAGVALGTMARLRQYLQPGLVITAIAAVGLLVLLFFLQEKRRELLYYASLALTTNCLVFLGIPWLIHKNRIIDRLPLRASAMKTLIDHYIVGILNQMNTIGMILLLGALLLILAYGIWCLILLLHARRSAGDPS